MLSLVPHLLFVLCLLYLSTLILCVLPPRRRPFWTAIIAIRFVHVWELSLRRSMQKTAPHERTPLPESSPTN
jgi:hypothetical protein